MGEANRKAESKKEAFEKNPDRFVDKEDLVLSVLKNKDKNGNDRFSFFLNAGIPPMLIGALIYKLQRHVTRHLDMLEIMNEADAAKDKKIITP